MEQEYWVSCSLESYFPLTTKLHGGDKLAEANKLSTVEYSKKHVHDLASLA